MARDSPDRTAPETSSELSGIQLRLNQAMMVTFLVGGLVSIVLVFMLNPENAAGLGTSGPRGGLIGPLTGTPRGVLLPVAMFGLAGYSYLYIRRHT